jgi:hypothetical protein
MDSKFLNKGTLSGLATILSGILAIFSSYGATPPDLIVSAIALLAGIVTTKDSIDARK